MKLIGYNARRKMFSMIVIGMLLVVGCSNPNTSDSGTSDADDSQEVTDTSQDVIEIEMWTRDYLADVAKDAAERFHDVSDDIRVNVVELPADQFSDQLSLALSSGEAPDIVSIDCTKAPYYSSIGAFVDITDKYESLDYKDNFSEGMVKLGKYEDEIYALPFAPDVSVLLYNKDHFEEAGLDSEKPPTTWDELFDYGEKLTTEDRYGYVYAGGDAGAHMFTFMPYVWNNGGQVLNEDGTECLLNENNAIEALQMFVDLTNKYKATPPSVTTYSWNEAQDAFLTRKSSMVVLGSPAIYMLNDDEYADLSWGVSLLPKGANGSDYASFSGGDSIGITTQSKEVDAAWEFIQFCLSEDVQIQAMAKRGMLPARSDFFDNEYFDSMSEYQVLQKALEVGHAPYSLKYDEMYTPILGAMQRALDEQKSAEEAFGEAAEEINKIIQ